MSIIYDALKKAENNPQTKQKPTKNNNAKAVNLQDNSVPHKGKSLLKFFAATIFVAGLCALAVMVIPEIDFSSFIGKYMNNSNVVKQGSLTYTLEGVIYDGQVPLALINGDVYGLRDVVDGFVISNIERDRVTLRSKEDNSRLVLSL